MLCTAGTEIMEISMQKEYSTPGEAEGEQENKIGWKFSGDSTPTEAVGDSPRSSKSWTALRSHLKLGQRGWSIITVLGCDHLGRGHALAKAAVCSQGRPRRRLRVEDCWQPSYSWETFAPAGDAGQHIPTPITRTPCGALDVLVKVSLYQCGR